MSKKKQRVHHLKFVLIFTIAMFAIVGANYLIRYVKSTDYFNIKTIVCKGVVNSNQSSIDKVVKRYIGKNIFTVNDKTRVLIDDVWISKAIISKKLPDKLVVKIYEKKPLFIYKKNNRCYKYLSGGDTIRVSCKKNKADIIDMTKGKILDDFSNIYNKELFYSDKIKLHRSYFEVIKKDFKILCSYEGDVFKRNFNIFQSAIKSRYKNINYVDLRVNGKIYVDGVLHEAG